MAWKKLFGQKHFAGGVNVSSPNDKDVLTWVNGSTEWQNALRNTLLLSEFGAPAVDVAWNGKKITGLASPTGDNDAARLIDVNNAIAGLTNKESVRGLYDTNVAITGVPAARDGITYVADDLVLLTAQSTASQGGPWIIKAGAWERPTNFAAASTQPPNCFWFIREGTTYSDNGWQLTNDADVTVDTTSLTFGQFSSQGAILAGTGMTKSGNTLNAIGGNGITANADDLAVDLDGATLSVSASGVKIAVGSADHVWVNDGSGVPSSEAQLGVSRGGLGISGAAFAKGSILWVSATGVISELTKGTQTQVLTMGASDAVTWGDAGAPSAHASTHQNGGADEVAVASPAANAIPKAGAGGTLDGGWVPYGFSADTALEGDSTLNEFDAPVAAVDFNGQQGTDFVLHTVANFAALPAAVNGKLAYATSEDEVYMYYAAA